MRSQERGRVNQKQRTRTALLKSAAELLRDGENPTVGQVAESAGISRATAYRYFPSQELLLAEAALDAAVPDIAGILTRVDGEMSDPYRQIDALVHEIQEWVADHEVLFRTLLRVSMDPALDEVARKRGGPPPRRRGGRRMAWIEEALEPARAQLTAERFRMLVAALTLFTGFETQVALRDVCGLDRAEADSIARWGAAAMLRGALAESGET